MEDVKKIKLQIPKYKTTFNGHVLSYFQGIDHSHSKLV